MVGIKIIKVSFLGLFSAFILILGIQLLKWEQFSFDMTWFQMKRMTGQTRVSDWLSYGAICNSLKKTSCAMEAFREVLKYQPQNRTAMANLAINYCQSNRWKNALPLFAAYFSLKGSGYDVMYWYAKAFNHAGEPEKSIQWYYNALNKKRDYIEAAKELVDLLMGMQRWFEAFSLVAQLTDGQPEKDVYWSQKILSMNAFMWEQIKKNNDAVDLKLSYVRLPAFVDERFFLPFWLAPHDPVHFFIVTDEKDDKEEKNAVFIDEEIGDSKKITQFLQLGAWSINKINFILCQKCEMKMSQSKLKEFGFHINNRTGVMSFLLLSKEGIKK